MTSLSDFGAGVPPEKRDSKIAYDSRSERAKQRRRQYRLGRCRAISKSKFCRCGGGVVEEADGDLCYYHWKEDDAPATQAVTIYDEPELLARWCGTRGTMWEEIPEPCRDALNEVCDA